MARTRHIPGRGAHRRRGCLLRNLQPVPLDVGSLSSKRRTSESIFERPTRSDIPWRTSEDVVVALGGEVTPGRGSRRRFFLVRPAVFRKKPHPERVTDKGAVDSVRTLLRNAGAIPPPKKGRNP